MNYTIICAVHAVTESTEAIYKIVYFSSYEAQHEENEGGELLCHLSSSSKIDGRVIITRVLSGRVNVINFPDNLQ